MGDNKFNIELLLDIFYVHNYLSNSKLYNYSKERYITVKEKSNDVNKIHYSRKIKIFWESIISGAFIKITF
jgi:hypothetical protein